MSKRQETLGPSLSDSFKAFGVADVQENPRPMLQRQTSSMPEQSKEQGKDLGNAPLTPTSKLPNKVSPLSRQSSITSFLFDSAEPDTKEDVTPPVTTRATVRLQRQSSMAAAFAFDSFDDDTSATTVVKTIEKSIGKTMEKPTEKPIEKPIEKPMEQPEKNSPDPELSEEQFVAAAGSGNLSVMKSLIAHVNIDCKDGAALHAAVANDHLVVVEYLLKRGALVNLECVPGSFPLFTAASKGYLGIVEQLVRNGAELDQRERKQVTVHNKTCCYVAAENGHELCVDYLVTKGCNLNLATNEDFSTVVHLLAKKNNLMSVTMMISHGADVSIKNAKGKTCLDLLQSERERLKVMVDADITQPTVVAYNYALWFAMIKEDALTNNTMDMADVFAFTMLINKVEKLLLSSPSLATAKDTNGRFAMDVASKVPTDPLRACLTYPLTHALSTPCSPQTLLHSPTIPCRPPPPLSALSP